MTIRPLLFPFALIINMFYLGNMFLWRTIIGAIAINAITLEKVLESKKRIVMTIISLLIYDITSFIAVYTKWYEKVTIVSDPKWNSFYATALISLFSLASIIIITVIVIKTIGENKKSNEVNK